MQFTFAGVVRVRQSTVSLQSFCVAKSICIRAYQRFKSKQFCDSEIILINAHDFHAIRNLLHEIAAHPVLKKGFSQAGYVLHVFVRTSKSENPNELIKS